MPHFLHGLICCLRKVAVLLILWCDKGGLCEIFPAGRYDFIVQLVRIGYFSERDMSSSFHFYITGGKGFNNVRRRFSAHAEIVPWCSAAMRLWAS